MFNISHGLTEFSMKHRYKIYKLRESCLFFLLVDHIFLYLHSLDLRNDINWLLNVKIYSQTIYQNVQSVKFIYFIKHIQT